MSAKVWSDVLRSVPMTLRGQFIVEEYNRIIYPVQNTKFNVRLVCNDVDVLPCESCVSASITSNISYNKLNICAYSDVQIRLDYDLCILCNGQDGHVLQNDVFSIMLCFGTE